MNDGYFSCIARDRGDAPCRQPSVTVSSVDHQVVLTLKNLEIPHGYQGRVEQAVRNRVKNAEALKHMAEIQEIVEREDLMYNQIYASLQSVYSTAIFGRLLLSRMNTGIWLSGVFWSTHWFPL